MDRSPKLSGETLIVHHIPLVHCQVSGSRQAGSGGSLKRSNPFSSSENLGLSRTTSLPETDILQKDGLLYGSLVHTSSGGRAREAGDERRGDSSTHSQDHLVIAHTLPRAKTCNRNPLRHNPFLLNTDHCEEDEEEDEDGDNLYGYLEDSSFHLHGRPSSTLEEEVVPFRLHDLDLGSGPFALRGALGKKWGSVGEESQESLRGVASELSNHLDDLRLLGLAGQRRHGSSGSNMSMDCVEQDWAEEDEEDEDQHMGCGRSSKTVSSCNSHDYQEHFLHSFPEPFSEGGQQGYGSDSSCNSSDGVLVNFSAIYNKMSKPTNLNYSRDPSLSPGSQRNPTVGAFYLDLHTSPNEPLPSHQQNALLGQPFPAVQEPHPAKSSTRSSSTQEGHDLDANCNSYHPLHSGSSGDLTSCLQSQARLVVATQNYYKLVTCDLSSQSSPSPVGSSATSCSEEPSKGSPTPNHPREYYLFRPGEDTTTASLGPNEDEEKNEDDPTWPPEDRVAAAIQGQLYVNSVNGNASCAGGPRPRSRSYDRNLGQVPPARLGSLERMLSCPVRLSDTAAQLLSPPPRVTSFAEIARSKRRSGGGASSPTLKGGEALFSGCPYASLDAFPQPEPHTQGGNPGPSPLAGCCSMGSLEPCLLSGMEAHAQGSLCISKDGSMEMVRYSKDQRPTTLPIQPFSFQHPLGARPPQPKPLRPLLAGMGSGVGASGAQTRGPAGTLGGEGSENSSEGMLGHQGSRQGPAGGPPPGSIRPSPLGSYSPVRHQGAVSSGTCSTCTPSPQSACNRSCLLSPGLGPLHSLPSDPFRQAPPPDLLGQNAESIPPTLSPVQGHCYHGAAPSMPRDVLGSLGSLVGMDSSRPPDGTKGSGCRPYNAHHLSPQALKWREYRRRNPLGVERSPDSASGGKAPRSFRRNVFDFPSAPSDHAPSSHAPRHHGGHSYSELLLDYFSLTEKPPEEFCLSPEPPSSKPSVDLPHKKGLVKAVNTAVDLIVAHFGTSRDPDVKAKLGNSWVSPNVGHLILKYLCPALREVLQDGLKAHLLDLIVGQRRCQPWSLVEASTQLGPSTRLLYALFSKVSQFSELTSHHMRLNAFIFGLLNLRSLEFWFNHVYTHEDIVAAHYEQWGFLPLSQGPCRALFEELLLLLQPLSLLPFDLDVLFESHLLQKDQEHLLRKLQLCSVDQSSRSTFQLMRGWGTAVTQSLKEGGEAKKERAGLRREGTGPRMDGTGGSRDGGNNVVLSTAIVSRKTTVEGNLLSTRVIADLWPERGMSGQRMKGVGEESHAEDGQRKRVKERDRDLDRQAGWWYQLMQSSQVYIDPSAEGSKFIKSEKRRRSSERRQPPPTREGVVEGAESKQEAEEHVGRRSLKAPIAEARSRPSWMGSPPESVLSQEKETAGPEAAGPGAEAPGTAVPAESPLWGRLFGSTLGSPSRKEGAQQRARKSRPPSGWLGLDRSVLDLMTQTLGSGTGKKGSPILPSQSKDLNPTSASTQPSSCEVQALCHHIASEPGHLSFHKGDRLKVLNKASADWLLCSLGGSQGLVPIVYITLEHKEDRL